MHISCFTLTLLVAATSALRLDKFALTTDYGPFFDEVLYSVKKIIPAYLPQLPVNLDVTESNLYSSTTNSVTDPTTINPPVCGNIIAQFSCPNPILGNLSTAKRTSEVISKLGRGNLTLSTNLSFGNFMWSCPQARVTAMGLEFIGFLGVTMTRNRLKMNMTVHSKQDGSCGLDLEHAAFDILDNFSIFFTPMGYYDKLQFNAEAQHLNQSIVQLINIDVESLQNVIERVVCSYVTDGTSQETFT